VMGVRSHERVGRVMEGMTILRRLWSEARVTHQGKYYHFSDVELLPKPIQQPVPIYMAINPKEERVDAATVDRILRRVAAHADGWQTDATPVQTFRQRFDTIRDYAARRGRDAAKLESCLHLMVNINDDRDAAFSEAETFLRSYYGAGAVSRQRADLWLACGPPIAVIDKIQAYIDAGCTTPVLRFVSPDLKGQLQRCIEEVLPAFQDG
jgi:alkanesulfonate monooxygenase SsuD/methylene tetrahydromethanopterin reductase-like flavin-dependent oxidoreductase (luciferase family)